MVVQRLPPLEHRFRHDGFSMPNSTAPSTRVNFASLSAWLALASSDLKSEKLKIDNHPEEMPRVSSGGLLETGAAVAGAVEQYQRTAAIRVSALLVYTWR